MTKKQYVVLAKRKRTYKLYADDIQNVRTLPKKKTPPLPNFTQTSNHAIPIQPNLDLFLA